MNPPALNEHQCVTSTCERYSKVHRGLTLVSTEAGVFFLTPSFKKIKKKKGGGGVEGKERTEKKIKEEKKENTGPPSTCTEPGRQAQLEVVKGADALLVLVAVAPVTAKPVGGAMELWLGCRSLGMPLWELSWCPKAALN